ncbi:MAG: septum formation initiator family protein [Desulfuromonadaceae bacterium]|nr:septum formation initiator family protein [Desulfuromonadaceae bacterium]
MASESPEESGVRFNPVHSRCCCLAFLVLIGLGFALFGDKGALRLRQVGSYQQQLVAELALLKEESGRLRNEIEALQNDDRYLEQVARGALSLVREGEVVYQFAAPVR